MADADGPRDRRMTTGSPLLDSMLGGGFPASRSVLLTGGPGTGKSTLAMQFLQAGLAEGDRCLYVTTEQSRAELRDSFSGYGFDLDHENLTVATLDATVRETVEGTQELALDTLDDREFEDHSPPFTPGTVRQYIASFAPQDRVVFDSVSALAVVSQRDHVYRRLVLDLIRLFTDDMDATSVFVAERVGGGDDVPGEGGVPSGDEVQFSTHGVLTLWRERVDEDVHRFLRVSKMRGVDHDRRAVEMRFDDGVVLGPARRSQPPALKQHSHASVGIPGLDALTGGGFVRGGGVLLRHDGQANLGALFSTLLAKALADGYTIELVPTIQLRPTRLAGMLAGYDLDLDALLAADRLFVLDMIGAWEAERENVFAPPDDTSGVKAALSGIADRAEPPHYRLVNADAMVHALGADGAREVRYHQEATLLGDDDTLVHVQNPDVVGDDIAALYADTADQVLDTRLTGDGLQYVTLRKSPCGFVGSTSLVEYRSEPPFLRVQRPPRDREHSRER